MLWSKAGLRLDMKTDRGQGKHKNKSATDLLAIGRASNPLVLTRSLTSL